MTEVYILGGDQTDFARNWAREGLGIYDLFAEPLQGAVAASGIDPGQIESGHVGNFVGDLFARQGILGGFFGHVFPELDNMPTARHEAACASGSVAILSAMNEILAGHLDISAVVGLELMRNVPGETGAEYLGAATWNGAEAGDCRYPWPHMFDRILDEYEERHGIDTDHLKTIAKINFDNARRNPRAQARNWQFTEASFTDDDEANPPIEGRIRKMDCGQITDGSAAIILASRKAAEEHARKHGLRLEDIPRIKGWGHRSSTLLLDRKLELSKGQPLLFPHARSTFEDALRRAGFDAITDVDGLETHDCFTVTEYMAIDHSGLTEPGKSWQAIESGRIAPDGDFPINPSGGLIGLGHPVGATGVRMVLDCARQVSGTAGDYQLRKAENMITFNVGGSTTTCASFVVGVG
ncbi:MAG: acetyl-CoA acetyltransferase [Lysobacterales bacterium]|jgi:acetyl-CoA C-acetyltransferase